MTDHEWSELAAPYALGALAPDERERFEAHLADCAACRAEVRALRDVAVLLADAAPAATPPPGLRDRVLREARQARPIRRARGPVVPWLAAAACIVIALGLGYGYLRERAASRQTSAAPAGRTYQLWAIAQGKPVSLGVFNTAADGRVTAAMAVPPGLTFELSAVTEEPAGGSPQPTQQPFLVGKVTPAD